MVFEEARKIKNMLIRLIEFAFAKKKVPGEVRDTIDLEQEVGVSDATVRAYMSAKTRKEKGEVISELYRETIKELVKNHPALRPFFPEYEVAKYDIWTDIQDQQRWINMLWDTYRAAEAGEEWAIELIREEEFRDLDEFRRYIEEEERKLEEMIRELEKVTPPPKKPKKAPVKEEKLPIEEEAEKRVEEAEKRTEELERRLDRLTRLLESTIAEKLTWFVRSKLLERGLSVAEMRRIADAMAFDIAQFAKDVTEGKLTQTEAESRLLSELERRIREMPMSKAEAMKKLEEEYLTYLREQGVTNVRQVLEAVREDIEALAEEVAAGRLTLEEALQRVREIPMPPIARLRKVVAPPVAPPPEEVPPEVPPEVPEAFLTPKEAADIIWNEYLPDLFNFGLGYVFENYMRRRGMTAGMRSRVAEILASYLRTLGLEMERRGKEEEKGRLMWAGEALVKYAPEIVWFGILRPFARYAAELWPTLRYFPNIVKALQATGIENCIAKALVGVVYDYLKISYEAWPSDVLKCYQTLQDVAGVDP
jgi:hypothetical protein